MCVEERQQASNNNQHMRVADCAESSGVTDRVLRADKLASVKEAITRDCCQAGVFKSTIKTTSLSPPQTCSCHQHFQGLPGVLWGGWPGPSGPDVRHNHHSHHSITQPHCAPPISYPSSRPPT